MDAREQFLYRMLGKQVHIQIDRPIGYLHESLVYPVNYGFLPGVMGGDGEEQDVYILGVDEPLASFDGIVVGAVRRRNDCEDKLIAAPEGMRVHQGQIAEAVKFQEQYFDSYIISLLRKSCGVIPYRDNGTRTEVLVVYETFSKCWSLPKGHMEAGETETQTALRELYEETGLSARLEPRIRGCICYPISPAGVKEVVFFPGKVSGDLRARDGEIETCRWIGMDELDAYLFPDTAGMCREVLGKILSSSP